MKNKLIFAGIFVLVVGVVCIQNHFDSKKITSEYGSRRTTARSVNNLPRARPSKQQARPMKMVSTDNLDWDSLISKSGATEGCKKQWRALLSSLITPDQIKGFAKAEASCKQPSNWMNGLWETVRKTCSQVTDDSEAFKGVCQVSYKSYHDTLAAMLTKSLSAKELKDIDTLKMRAQMELQSPEQSSETIKRILELQPDNVFAKTFDTFIHSKRLTTESEYETFSNRVSQLRESYSEESGMRAVIDSWYSLKVGDQKAAVKSLITAISDHPLSIEYHVMTGFLTVGLVKKDLSLSYDPMFLSLIAQTDFE